MRVLYDYQIFDQAFGGISKYFYNLILEFNKMSDIEIDLALKYTSNEHLAGNFHGRINPMPFAKASNNYLKKGINRFARTINKNTSMKYIKRNKYDIFHPTYYNTYHISKVSQPTILTVYDLIHEKFGNYLKNVDDTTKDKKKLCNTASKILAISESTKIDLIEILGIPEEKIIVTPLAGGFENNSIDESVKATLPDRYLLFVGNRNGYKNFKLFLEAITPILKKDKTLNLICTGRKFQADEIDTFKKLSVANQVFHRFPTDQEFYTYYNSALAFVFPTLYEGFGIPTLEAFSANCPAILSDTSSLPEVGGDAAEYFNPESRENMKEVIENVIYDGELRFNMIAKGKIQLKKYSWQKTAKMTKEVYEQFV